MWKSFISIHPALAMTKLKTVAKNNSVTWPGLRAVWSHTESPLWLHLMSCAIIASRTDAGWGRCSQTTKWKAGLARPTCQEQLWHAGPPCRCCSRRLPSERIFHTAAPLPLRVAVSNTSLENAASGWWIIVSTDSAGQWSGHLSSTAPPPPGLSSCVSTDAESVTALTDISVQHSGIYKELDGIEFL